MPNQKVEAASATGPTDIGRAELYKQGSECCRNYSELTMKVRTLAQQVMLAYAVGMGLVLTRGESREVLLFGAGIILILFATALWVLNEHYSRAFTRIRDNCLIPLEDHLGIVGPWKAHQTGQPSLIKEAAWHWPYIVLIFVGLLTMILALAWKQ